MVLPIIAAAAIGAGGALIDGVANRNAVREANDANRPVNQVAEWEDAGINPIFGISSGAHIPHQAATIGDTFSKVGGAFSDAIMFNHEQSLRETELQKENDRLKEGYDKLAKPVELSHLQKHGGSLPLPSIGDTHENAGQNRQGLFGGLFAPWGAPDDHERPYALGREVELAPVASGAGITELENGYTRGTIYLPGNDGEPWGIDEVITAGLVGGPQLAWNYYSDFIGDPFARSMKGALDKFQSKKTYPKKQKRGDRRN